MAGDPHPLDQVGGLTADDDLDNVDKPQFRAFVKERTALAMQSASEIRSTDLAGQKLVTLLATGRVYKLTAGDSTTDDDGVNCIRDANNLAFILQEVTGVDGEDGTDPGILLNWDTGTADADPGAGELRANDASLAAATVLYISKTNRAGSSLATFLAALDDSTNPTIKGTLILTNPADETQAVFQYGAVTDATNYIKLVVSGHSGATSFAAGAAISMQPERAGDRGAPGADANYPKATVAQVSAATADKAVTTDLIETASALVALTDAAPVAVDWDAAINFSLTVTANRAIGNPTNGQPGTYRTILVQGNDGTDRTITFGNQFLGALPTITDCDNAKWYLLTIRCITATHFVVGSQVAKT